MANHLEMSPISDEASFLGVFRPQVVYTPCSGTDTTTIGPRAQDVIEWLRSNKALSVGPPVPIRLGDLVTVQLDVGLGTGCGGSGEQHVFLIWSSQTKAGDIPQFLGYGVSPGARSRIYVAEVNGQAIIVSIDAPPGRFDAFAERARSVLSTFEIVR